MHLGAVLVMGLELCAENQQQQQVTSRTDHIFYDYTYLHRYTNLYGILCLLLNTPRALLLHERLCREEGPSNSTPEMTAQLASFVCQNVKLKLISIVMKRALA